MTDESSTPIRVLFVDDDRDVAAAARLALERQGIVFAWAADPAAAWIALTEHADVVVLDLNFSRAETSGAVGLELLARLILHDATLPIVVVTGHSGVAIAVSAMRAGASDFLIKPWRNERLVDAVTQAAAAGRARRARPTFATADPPILGDSEVIRAIRALIGKIAKTKAAVLIHGDAGTGKSLVASAIIGASGRGDPKVLRGRDQPGPQDVTAAIRSAERGTLLIEDVDLLNPGARSALADASVIDIRLIATTRRPPADLRASGTLGDEMLIRLSTVEIELPPLAARPGDALLLAIHYLGVHAARHERPPRLIDEFAAAAIAADAWPDGVRGLVAACERAVVLGEGERHGLADFALSARSPPGFVRAIAANFNLASSERKLVEAALKRHAYNVSRAASDLGITRATLYRRMAKHGL